MTCQLSYLIEIETIAELAQKKPLQAEDEFKFN